MDRMIAEEEARKQRQAEREAEAERSGPPKLRLIVDNTRKPIKPIPRYRSPYRHDDGPEATDNDISRHIHH